MDQESWVAIWTAAGVSKALAGPAIPGRPVVGRYISVLAVALANFWLRHRTTLIPVLSQVAIAALDAVAAAITAIKAVNPPGPG